MHILISNDDGVRAPGLKALAEALAPLAECTVIAPDRDRSGASHSLTLDRPLDPQHKANGFIAIRDGTPTDCVHLAMNGLLETPPDMVVSGINAGPNMGDDCLYSGTVAAAMEGRFLGLPAIAISLAGSQHYDVAGTIAYAMVERIQRNPLPRDTILNINVPDHPDATLDAVSLTRLGNRHRSGPVRREYDQNGDACYWIGPPGAEQDAGDGTDFHALASNRVSITPLASDLTRFEALPRLHEWMASCRDG